MVYFLPYVTFGCNSSEAFKSPPETWEAYFIKWTTSGETPVGSKRPWNSYSKSNKQLLSALQYERPCIYHLVKGKIRDSGFRKQNIV